MCPTKSFAELVLALRTENKWAEVRSDVSNKRFGGIRSSVTKRWRGKKTYHICPTKIVAELALTLRNDGKAKKTYHMCPTKSVAEFALTLRNDGKAKRPI